jgi:hypothetical protein
MSTSVSFTSTSAADVPFSSITIGDIFSYGGNPYRKLDVTSSLKLIDCLTTGSYETLLATLPPAGICRRATSAALNIVTA